MRCDVQDSGHGHQGRRGDRWGARADGELGGLGRLGGRQVRGREGGGHRKEGGQAGWLVTVAPIGLVTVASQLTGDNGLNRLVTLYGCRNRDYDGCLADNSTLGMLVT